MSLNVTFEKTRVRCKSFQIPMRGNEKVDGHWAADIVE